MSRSLKLTEVQREGAQTDPAEARNRRKVGKGKPTNIYPNGGEVLRIPELLLFWRLVAG
jgi:hypothetical protein